MGMFSAASDVAVDLGTVNTCIFTKGAVALSEPSVVAFNTTRGGIEAIGIDAHEMLGRTPANITPVWPMRNGVIADFEAVEKMLAYFVRKASGRTYWRPRLVIGVPAASTPVERRAVMDSAKRMKVGDVQLVDEPMAAAIGAGLPVTEPTGNMIVDIGGGTTDIAVVSLSGVVYGRSLRVAGGDMDEAIIQHLKRQHSLLIGEPTAERIKREIGSAAPLAKPLRMEVKGRHLSEGVPRTVRSRMRKSGRRCLNRSAASSRRSVKRSSACPRNCAATSTNAASCSRAGWRCSENSTSICIRKPASPCWLPKIHSQPS